MMRVERGKRSGDERGRGNCSSRSSKNYPIICFNSDNVETTPQVSSSWAPCPFISPANSSSPLKRGFFGKLNIGNAPHYGDRKTGSVMEEAYEEIEKVFAVSKVLFEINYIKTCNGEF